jgi:bacterial/archaeal transporter family protein
MNNTLISILAGLGGMFGWGTSDFLANISSEKIGHYKTFFYSQIAGLILVALIVLVKSAQFSFSPFLLFLMFVSGIGYAVGYLLFYKGFEIGNVSVVSAVINLQNIFVIGIAFFLFGQRIVGIQIPALALLLIGVTLVSVNFSDLKKGRVSLLAGVKETLLAAVLFGVFFWPVNQFIVQRADWLATNLITKFIAIATVFLISLLNKTNISLPIEGRTVKALSPVVAIGLLEATAVLSVSGGLSIGNAIIINPVASALTIVTVGLAIIFLKEKITKTQGFGILTTVAGIVMMGLAG